MEPIAGRMQLTLVSHYGPKESLLTDLINCTQDVLAENLKAAFRPYLMDQVHGTLVGLEGYRVSERIRNANWAEAGEERYLDYAKLLAFLRTDAFAPIDIQLGGYRHHLDYGFKSRGEHPYLRSFSIQGPQAVAMGWPTTEGRFPSTLDELRWRFGSDFGARHKWHVKDTDCDNDFFFVLGRVRRETLTEVALQSATERVRAFLAGLRLAPIRIDRTTLRIVAYLDPQLPPETSCAYDIFDNALAPDQLITLYEPG